MFYKPKYATTAIPSWKHHGSRKITEFKQLSPRLSLGCVTSQGLDVDAVVKNTVKSQKRINGASIKYSTLVYIKKCHFHQHPVIIQLLAQLIVCSLGNLRFDREEDCV